MNLLPLKAPEVILTLCEELYFFHKSVLDIGVVFTHTPTLTLQCTKVEQEKQPALGGRVWDGVSSE